MNNKKNIDIFFYSFVFIAFVLLLSTNPFLKYPFDVYIHLDRVEKQYNTNHLLYNRLLWHYIWAKIFHFLNINNNKIFLRAYIIHYTQIVISFISIFYFSFVFTKFFFNKIDKKIIKYIALWSTLIWFTIYATESIGIHQVWILWYSINYQITLPIVLVMLALTLSIIYEHSKLYKKLIYFFILLVLARIVIQMHAMEFLYYLMYIFTLILLYMDKFYSFTKKYKHIAIMVLFVSITLIIYMPSIINKFESKNSRILKYLSIDKLPNLYQQIMSDGALLVNKFSRISASINELIGLSLVLVFILLIIYLYQHVKNKLEFINFRLLLFLVISSSFVLIPVFKFTSGFAGMLVSSIYVVNRFYYSSLIFLVLPIFVYCILTIINKKSIKYLNLYIFLTLIIVYEFSKYNMNFNHNYYKNINSIINSYYKKNMSFNLSENNIAKIGVLKEQYKKVINFKYPYFFARDDISFILKYVYRENIAISPLKNKNRFNMNVDRYIENFNKDTYYKHKVLFKTPKDFPSYKPFH